MFKRLIETTTKFTDLIILAIRRSDINQTGLCVTCNDFGQCMCHAGNWIVLLDSTNRLTQCIFLKFYLNGFLFLHIAWSKTKATVLF